MTNNIQVEQKEMKSSALAMELKNSPLSESNVLGGDSFYDGLIGNEHYRSAVVNANGLKDRSLRSIESDGPTDVYKVVIDRLVKERGNDVARAFFDLAIREDIEKQIRFYLQDDDLVDSTQISSVAKDYTQRIVGLYPIEELMYDNAINEVMINGSGEVYIDKAMGAGQVKTNIKFDDEQQVLNLARKMLNLADASVNESAPICDARLPDMRINVVIPPIARNGTTITIRKFPPLEMTEGAMIKHGLLTQEMADQAQVLVEGGATILIAGATGSGKTTTMKGFAGYIPDPERTVTLEDNAELRLKELYPNKHIVSLECRITGNEKTSITLSDLLRATLRMYPQRLIVGEVRSKEALDMIEIFNTGHDGGMSSLHANNAEEVPTRVIQMVMRNGLLLSPQVIGEMVAKAIDLVYFQKKMSDGTRRITEVAEILGFVGNKAVLNYLYHYEVEDTQTLPNGKQKIIGQHVKGEHPYFSEALTTKLLTRGVNMNRLAPWIAPKGDQ